MCEQRDKIKEEQNSPDFWQDLDKARDSNKELGAIEKKLKLLDDLQNSFNDLNDYIQLFKEEQDESSVAEINSGIEELQKKADACFIETILSSKYDDCDAVLTLHAGAGGTEAQDWVQMLYRMYTRFCEREGYKIKVLDILDGDDAGIKSVSFLISGEKAYGYLKAERGVHRLVRISPFDSNKRRHTSFASLDVTPQIEGAGDLVIKPEDIRVDTYRSSGAGGQHVNTTDSAIRITHFPTGIVVTCQNERSQIQNRETAMALLKSKLIIKREEEEQANLNQTKGSLKKIEWGSQIRSYVFCPYTMVKDHRTNYETSDIDGVMDGDLKEFILDYLKKSV